MGAHGHLEAPAGLAPQAKGILDDQQRLYFASNNDLEATEPPAQAPKAVAHSLRER